MNRFSRREFLKLGAAGLAAGAIARARTAPALAQQGAVDRLDEWTAQYSQGEWLGRVLAKLNLRARPDAESNSLGYRFQDDVYPLRREVVGRGPRLDPHNHRWFETDDGYLWAPNVYPMSFRTNEPVTQIPNGKVWAEVTVPWVVGRTKPDVNAPVLVIPSGPAFLYYASVYPVTKVVKDDAGRAWYFLDELAAPMYARAEAFRIISAEEMAPISPNVTDKLIKVDLARQTLSARENGSEVFFTSIASGPFLQEDQRWSTPPGEHLIWWKRIGVRMSWGGKDYGYDNLGVGWSSFFVGDGVAIHSTYWHNDFGIPKSHGCVNARPQDAKWVFRWTLPVVSATEGDVRTTGSRILVVV